MSQGDRQDLPIATAKEDGTSREGTRRRTQSRKLVIEREIIRPDGTRAISRIGYGSQNDYEGLEVESLQPPRKRLSKIVKPLKLLLDAFTGFDLGNIFDNPPSDTEA